MKTTARHGAGHTTMKNEFSLRKRIIVQVCISRQENDEVQARLRQSQLRLCPPQASRPLREKALLLRHARSETPLYWQSDARCNASLFLSLTLMIFFPAVVLRDRRTTSWLCNI
jgi:hypothetical protein